MLRLRDPPALNLDRPHPTLPPLRLRSNAPRVAGARLLATPMYTASGPRSAVAAELSSASTVPPPATGTPETAAGGGTAALHRHRLAASPRPSSDCTLSIGAYNCEGLLSAFEYINDQILPLCDILVLSDSWLSRAEEAYPSRILAAAGHSSHQVFQTFAMETGT